MTVKHVKDFLEDCKQNGKIIEYELLISDREDSDLDAFINVKIIPIIPLNNIKINFNVKKI